MQTQTFSHRVPHFPEAHDPFHTHDCGTRKQVSVDTCLVHRTEECLLPTRWGWSAGEWVRGFACGCRVHACVCVCVCVWMCGAEADVWVGVYVREGVGGVDVWRCVCWAWVW